MPGDRAQLAADIDALAGLPIFVAYNANVDAVLRVDPGLEAYLDRPDDPESRITSPVLSSKQELAAAITRAMATGRGDQMALTPSFAATLEAELEPDTQQIGGQAGIMTNLLTALGAAPITYTYLVSERQQSMFDQPEAVRYPLVHAGTVRYIPLSEFVNADRTKINWVFEFRRGDELFGVRAAEDTRFIAASRPPEFNLIAGELDDAIDQIGEVVAGALLAGYHNLTKENVDDYEQAHRHASAVLNRLRSGSDLTVHIEYAVTHDEELRASMYEWILRQADVIGADTHEIAMLYHDADLSIGESPPTEETPFEERDILSHYRMLAAIRADLDIPCIHLHAMEYHLAVMDEYLPPDVVRRGLGFAAINAATKATTGSIANSDDLETGLTVDPSEQGIHAIEHLASEQGHEMEGNCLVTPSVVACPNRVVEDPTRTVGIGDVVSAASFILEMALTRSEQKNHATDAKRHQ